MNTLRFFDIIRPLAQGGMCTIWDAIHREYNVRVALKVMTKELARLPHLRRSFRDEVRAMARLQHTHIIEIFDFGEITPEQSVPPFHLPAHSPYLIMERGDGSLETLRGRLLWSELYPILLALLDALAHAHARSLLHRDLKPANILWKEHHTHIKLTDFGLAHSLESDEVPGSTKEFLGTPAFMAPEQFQRRWRDYGPWTDLYALGCTIYALLEGTPPFGSSLSLEAFKAAHMYQPVPSLPKHIALPEGAFRWIQQLLKKDPYRRFSCAADAARALRQIGSGQPEIRALTQQEQEKTQPKTKEESTQQEQEKTQPETRTLTEQAQEGVPLESEDMASWAMMGQEPTPAFHVEPLAKETPLSLPQMRSDSWELAQPSTLPESWRHSFKLSSPKGSPVKSLELFGMSPTPLVGRDTERDELWELVKHVQQTKKTHTIVLQGPLGCGKSRLAEWLCERISELGIGLSMRGINTLELTPFTGLGAMLSRHLQCNGLSYDETIERLQRSFLGREENNQLLIQELAECMIPIRPNQYANSNAAQLAPERRYEALGRFLQKRSSHSNKMMLVWLDDIQWGLDALGFVSYMMQQQAHSPQPILFVLTAQIEALAEQPSATALLEELIREPDTHNFEIGPLPPDHHNVLVRELLQLTGELAGQVEALTAGNPMFAEELVRDWIQRDWLYRDVAGFQLKPGITVGLPDNLYEVWQSRIARVLQGLSSEEQMALELAAALGRDVDLNEWQHVCKLANIPVSTKLMERLLDQRLAYRNLAHTSMGWSFVHNMLRESLKRSAQEDGRWQRLHHYCVEMLYSKKGPGVAERLGHHLIQAGKDEEAFPFLRMGIAERLNAGEYRQGQQSLDAWEALLVRLSWPTNHAYWGEYWMYRCRQARGLGDYEQAIHWASQAKDYAYQYNWPRTLTEALIHLGYYGWRNQEAFEICWEYLRQAEHLARLQKDRQSLAVCRRYMGHILSFQGKYEEATHYLSQALDDATSIEDYQLMGLACYSLGVIARQHGNSDKAIDRFTMARYHYERFGNHRGTADCLNALGDIARHKGEMLEAEMMYKQALQKYRQIGAGNAALIELNLGLVWIERKEYYKAYTALSQALQTFLVGGRILFACVAKMSLLPCLASMQDWDTWDMYFEEATRIFEEKGFTDADLARVSLMAGHMAQYLQEPERARQVYHFSHNQWLSLGRTDEAIAVKESMETLIPPAFARSWLNSFSNLEAI